MSYVVINKVREKWGELGNMAPFEVEFEGKVWPRSEQLFQALRLKPEAEDLREEIRLIKNPMTAKMKAKKMFKENPELVAGNFLCAADSARMAGVLRMKLLQNPKVQGVLFETGDREIVEDATRRQRGSGLYWGAALQEDGTWKGENMLGKLWMILREEYREEFAGG
jgi:ribA/ribD-fused uncharacterized protein